MVKSLFEMCLSQPKVLRMAKWVYDGVAYGKSRGWTVRAPQRRRAPPRATLRLPGPGAPLRRGPLVRPQMRMQSGRSYTQTETSTKKRPPQVISHGDNASSSYNRIGSKFKSRFVEELSKRIVSPQKVFSNGTSRLVSTTGKQIVGSFAFMTKSDLTAMETAAQGGVSNANSVRFVLRHGKETVTMRNQSNSNARVFLYDVVCKNDPPSAAFDSPYECWIKGNTDFGSVGAELVVGQTPLFSPEFKQFYSVNNVTQVHLEPGQQHVHTVYHYYNKVVDSVRFQNSVSLSLSGLTRFTMLVAYGALGHESATPATVTFLPVTLDLATSFEYSYGWIEKSQPTHTIVDANPTAVVDFDFMGEAGDADTNLVVA